MDITTPLERLNLRTCEDVSTFLGLVRSPDRRRCSDGYFTFLAIPSRQSLPLAQNRFVPATRNNFMGSSSSYAPNESQSTIIWEETWLQGALLSSVFFGVQSTLSVWAFLGVFRRQTHNRMRIVLLVYIGILIAITTAAQGLSFDFIQMGFITQRNYPGGPSAFFTDDYSVPINIAATVLNVCANWLMEFLMVWRCYVVCSMGGSFWWLGIAIPMLLLVTVFVMGSLFIHNIFHSAPLPIFALAYGISSFVLNFIVTGFIAGRLLVHRHYVIKHLGRGHAQYYASIVAVVVESASVYSGFLVIVIVAYAIGSPATNLLQQFIVQVQAIASLLIILRVAYGEAWSTSSSTQPLSVVVSSWDARVPTQTEQNVHQLEVLSTRPDEEESHIHQNEDKRGTPLVLYGGRVRTGSEECGRCKECGQIRG